MVRVTFAVYFGNIQTIFIIILALDVVVSVSKGAKIRNRYNQVTYLTQDTNEKVTNSQLDTTNESQEVSPLGTNKQMHTKAQQTQDRKNTTDLQKEHCRATKCSIHNMLSRGTYCVPCIHNMLPLKSGAYCVGHVSYLHNMLPS